MGAEGSLPGAYISAPQPPLSFIPRAFASPLSPSLLQSCSGILERLRRESSPPHARRCAGGSYGCALPSFAAPLIRRNGGEVFFAQAYGAWRCYVCGTLHQAVRLLDLEVGVDVRLHRQRLCGNVSRSRSTRVCIPYLYSLLYIRIA